MRPSGRAVSSVVRSFRAKPDQTVSNRIKTNQNGSKRIKTDQNESKPINLDQNLYAHNYYKALLQKGLGNYQRASWPKKVLFKRSPSGLAGECERETSASSVEPHSERQLRGGLNACQNAKSAAECALGVSLVLCFLRVSELVTVQSEPRP